MKKKDIIVIERNDGENFQESLNELLKDKYIVLSVYCTSFYEAGYFKTFYQAILQSK